MRNGLVVAAALALGSAGLLAATRPGGGDQAPKAQTRQKTIIVEKQGDDEDAPRAGRQMWRIQAPDYGVKIGVTVSNLDDEQARTMTGVVVASVREDGPAAKAGIKSGDVITEVDGEKVRSAMQMTRLVGETAPGRTVKLAVTRDGKRIELQVVPEAREMALLGDGQPWPFDNMPRMPRMPMPPGDGHEFHFKMPGGHERFEFRNPGDGDDNFDVFIRPGRGRLGIGIQDLTPQLAEYFGTKDGVLVSSVTRDSPAAKAGLRAGDVITAIDEKPVTSPDALVEAVGAVKDGGPVKVGYIRDRKPASVTATLEPRERPKRPARPA